MMSVKRSLDLDISNVSPQKRLKSSAVEAAAPPTPPPSSLASTPSTPRSNNDPRPRIYACSFAPCTAVFTRPCRQAEHERSHTGERPFVCDQCDKTFSRDYHLSRHIALSHTDVREYVCEWPGCGKAFATAQRKNGHEKTHERVKTFTCEYTRCGEVFRKKNTLAAHVAKIHLGVKPFPCTNTKQDTGESCKAAYDTQGKLNEHMRKWHSGPRFFCTLCIVDTAGDTSAAAALQADIEMGGLASPTSATSQQSPGFATLQLLLAHKQTHHPTISQPRNASSAAAPTTKKVRIAKPRARNNQHTATTSQPSPLSSMLLSSNTATTNDNIASASASITTTHQIACLKYHCSRYFTSEAELEAHCQLEHGMALVEIADALYERNALQSGVFWLGGIEPGHERELLVEGDDGDERIDVNAPWDMEMRSDNDMDVEMSL